MAIQTETQPVTTKPNLASSMGKSTLLGMVANVTQVGTRLVTVPIVIHSLGLGGYGIWNIIMMTSTYMRFGSVGIKSAFQKYVAEATGNGDYASANKLLSTGCALMLALSILGLIPVSIFSRQIAHAAGVPAEFLKSAAGSIALLAWIMAMSNVGAAFEAIVMGGHRIDLVRRFTTVLTVLEAVAIVITLHLGYGLFTMSAIMGTSELVYVSLCYFASRRVLPQVVVSAKSVTKEVLYELFRFAGSYQLVNILEIVYVSIVPFAILRSFGANSAGVYAVVTRVVTSAVILQDSFLAPVLSGGTMVFASGSLEKMQSLLVKAFKVTTALSVLPLGFIAVFGSSLAYAWTGETDPAFRISFWLITLTALFKSFSLLSLVLYRVSGKALMDNLRQGLRIIVILAVALFAPHFGFYAVLAGLALAELAGMIFMLYALSKTFERFEVFSLLGDMARFVAAAALILGGGFLVSYLPIPGPQVGRLSATLKLAEISIGCLLIAWPALRITGSITSSEVDALLGTVFRKRRAAALPVG